MALRANRYTWNQWHNKWPTLSEINGIQHSINVLCCVYVLGAMKAPDWLGQCACPRHSGACSMMIELQKVRQGDYWVILNFIGSIILCFWVKLVDTGFLGCESQKSMQSGRRRVIRAKDVSFLAFFLAISRIHQICKSSPQVKCYGSVFCIPRFSCFLGGNEHWRQPLSKESRCMMTTFGTNGSVKMSPVATR